jgi:hypothetical protein
MSAAIAAATVVLKGGHVWAVDVEPATRYVHSTACAAFDQLLLNLKELHLGTVDKDE